MAINLKLKVLMAPLLAIALLIACGGSTLIQSIRATIAASAPLRASLVASGAIDESFSAKLATDFSDTAGCAETLQADFSAIPKDAPYKKLQKLNASVKASRCWRVVVDRQNFAKNPKVRYVADIIDGIFASLVVFYSEPGTMRASVAGPKPTPLDESKLEVDLEKRLKELKAAMKP